MSEDTRKFSDLLRDESSGGEKPAGLSWEKIKGDIGAELKHLGAQGAHELAAALFHGNAFVMYPHAGEQGIEEPQHGLPVEPMQKEVDNGMER